MAATNAEARDILIRRILPQEFLVVDTATRERIAGPFDRFSVALTTAKAAAKGHTIWLEVADTRGRPLKDPVRIPPML